MSNHVAIIGGGPVGMALALALHQQGVAAEVHDLRPRGAAAGDQRVLALSHGSQQTLTALG
ncbi:MAG TPA: FAD-dependent monooxygenase, partial [Rhodocyclaceae bacterium]|nr:FAD-dependent monooxygenase [Rhodocyclaceae bacterium]